MDRLNEVTPKSLYDFYRKNILDNSYKIYISGALDDEDKFKKDFEKIFDNKNEKKSLEFNYQKYFVPGKYEHRYEKTKYEQSVLFINYNIKDMKDSDQMKFYMLQILLSSKENDLIYNYLRVKNNLVYSSKINSYRNYGTIDIIVYFNNYDYQKLIDLVNEIIFKLKEKEFFDYCKEKMVKASEYDLLYMEDEPFGEVADLVDVSICDDITYKEKLNAIKNIEYEEFIEFLDRLTLTKSFLFESGDKND